MSNEIPIVDTSRRSDRIMFGFYLAAIFILAHNLVIFIHELGHVIADVLIGNVIYGFYVSPYIGQVLSYPRTSSWQQGCENLAGIIATHLVGYAVYPWVIRRRNIRTFMGESFLLLFLFGLFLDSFYLLVSALFDFGDGAQAAYCFGVPRYCFCLIGAFFSAINACLLKKPFEVFFNSFCPRRTLGEHKEILEYFWIALLVMIVVYFALLLVRIWS